jgi:hypothetical protein
LLSAPFTIYSSLVTLPYDATLSEDPKAVLNEPEANREMNTFGSVLETSRLLKQLDCVFCAIDTVFSYILWYLLTYVYEIFHLNNPSGRTMALGSTPHLT